jgi:hypothetical protein
MADARGDTDNTISRYNTAFYGLELDTVMCSFICFALFIFQDIQYNDILKKVYIY